MVGLKMKHVFQIITIFSDIQSSYPAVVFINAYFNILFTDRYI